MTIPKKKKAEAGETLSSSVEQHRSSTQRRVRGEETDSAIQLLHLRFLAKNV